MAGLPTTSKNTMLASLFTGTMYASLHTADPGLTGASEASGGSPAYARQSFAWGAPSNGTVSGGTVTFNVGAGSYAFIGYWTAASGGTYIGGYALNGTFTAAAQTTLPVTLSESLS